MAVCFNEKDELLMNIIMSGGRRKRDERSTLIINGVDGVFTLINENVYSWMKMSDHQYFDDTRWTFND